MKFVECVGYGLHKDKYILTCQKKEVEEWRKYINKIVLSFSKSLHTNVWKSIFFQWTFPLLIWVERTVLWLKIILNCQYHNNKRILLLTKKFSPKQHIFNKAVDNHVRHFSNVLKEMRISTVLHFIRFARQEVWHI